MKTVIEMARESADPDKVDPFRNGFWVLTQEELEKFAELVRADEREAMMQLFTDPENQPTQYGTVTVGYMQREIEAERDACVKLVAPSKEHRENPQDYIAQFDGVELLDYIAADIRARGNT